MEQGFVRDEIQALKDLHEHCWSGRDATGHKWVLMKWRDGVPITETAAYKAAKSNGASCEKFVKDVHQIVQEKVQKAFNDFHWWHGYVQ